MNKTYHLAALGGTFDHFHLGHEHLIKRAVDAAGALVIGLTQKKLQQSKAYAGQIEPYSVRQANVLNYLRVQRFSKNVTIVPLDDPFGPTLTNTAIGALVVSRQTLPGAHRLNQARAQRRLPALPVVVAEMVRDDQGEHISSTRIRAGEIDRRGQTYFQAFHQDLVISSASKQRIRPPQGTIVSPQALSPRLLNSFSRVALVGDQTTEFFLKHKLPFHYAVIDQRINRRAHATNVAGFKPQAKLQVVNPPGSILALASQAIRQLVQNDSGLLVVEGEEDLLGFPLLAVLPLGSALFYGQPDLGLVKLEVTENLKTKLISLVSGVDI